MVIDGTDPFATAKPNARLVKLLLRARRFNAALTQGEGIAFAALAQREGVSRSYFTRLVRLSYLAPDITQAILDGRQPRDLTPEKLLERDHDFLWRVHPHVPGPGKVAIFNRSHYEDVLVTRVHKLIDKKTCARRYEHIRDFEALLVESGTTILKFFLHISKEEQLARFAQRLDDPGRNWKISESDYSERELWDDYVDAYEDAIGATSAANAPWYVIPANHKWFRNLAVSQIIADSMADLGLAFPAPSVNLADIKRKYHAAVEEGKDRRNPAGRKKG
jgi:hypothetical protein